MHLSEDRVRIVAQDCRAERPRLPEGNQGVSNLPARRVVLLQPVRERRGHQHSMAEHLFQSGPAAEDVIAAIVHADRYT